MQIFGEAIGSKAMWSLPWSNIPTLLVPFYLIIHGVIFAKLAQASGVAVVQAVLSMVRLRGRTRRGDVAARCCFSRGECCGMMAQTRAGKASARGGVQHG